MKLKRITVVLLVAILLAISISCVSSATEDKEPLLIGHRGYSSKYPENTMKAFKGAIKYGFDGIECDLWESENGDLLVHHDSTIERMCGVKKYVWEVNTKNRKKYPVVNGNNSEKYTNNKLYIPTIQEVIDFAKESNCYLIIHIKNIPNKVVFSQSASNKLTKYLSKANIKDKTYVMCHFVNILNQFDKGKVNTAVTTSDTGYNKLLNTQSICKRNNIKTIIHTAKIPKIKNSLNGNNLMSTLHSKKIKFGTYYTNTKKQYEYLKSIGADFAMSDYKLR